MIRLNIPEEYGAYPEERFDTFVSMFGERIDKYFNPIWMRGRRDISVVVQTHEGDYAFRDPEYALDFIERWREFIKVGVVSSTSLRFVADEKDLKVQYPKCVEWEEKHKAKMNTEHVLHLQQLAKSRPYRSFVEGMRIFGNAAKEAGITIKEMGTKYGLLGSIFCEHLPQKKRTRKVMTRRKRDED